MTRLDARRASTANSTLSEPCQVTSDVSGTAHDGHMTVAIALPAVTGQHRNRALATARRAEAVRLRTQGLSYEQIATRLGYSNRGTVYRIVSQAVRADVAEAAEELRELELSRLDALQDALWERAMGGDVSACEAVARVICTRCQILGLAGGLPTSTAPRTVVVGPAGD